MSARPDGSDFLRGEEMKLCQIYFQSEVAYSCVSQLGEMGVVQFNDLNPSMNSFQRKYVNDVRRCEEMERKLRYIEAEISKEKDIKVQDAEETREAPKPKDTIQLEAKLEQLEHDLLEVNTNKEALRKNYLELVELRHILVKATQFFEENDKSKLEEAVGGHSVLSMEGPGVASSSSAAAQSMRIGFIAGVIHRDKVPAFELMLWRFCRGNVFLKSSEIEEHIEDSQTNEMEPKSVFIIFFQGEQLKAKCKKICEGFKSTIYPCPETRTERSDMLNGVSQRLSELNTVLNQSLSLRRSLLLTGADNLNTWFWKVRKMKAVFHTLNMFRYDQKSVIGECWAPTSEIARIKEALDKETKKIDNNFQTILNYVPTKRIPPTYHRCNKMTAAFQSIVNAYGVPSYREINPMPFTLITFPFMFALMFGDLGHGFLVVLTSLFMVRRENALKKSIRGNEVLEIFFGGRYIILLMGLFSLYTGLVYNDVFSKSMNLFGSSWRVALPMNTNFESFNLITLNPDPLNLNNATKMYSGNPYPFGLDPIWQLGANKITYTNTMKMKFAIIIGITHMMFGLALGLKNHLYFKRRINIFFEFIPQLLFITLIFVYLCFMIIFKWIKYSGSIDPETGTCAPNLLLELINMFFLKDTALEADGVTINKCIRLYPGQPIVQKIFVVIAVLCIPVMLLAKPIILYVQHKKKLKHGSRLDAHTFVNPAMAINGHDNDFGKGTTNTSSVDLGETEDDEEEKFEMSEVFVEQAIHTIEYFLGCISKTASYLRLWALSLAHAELSEVLWTMLFSRGLSMAPPVGIFVMFAIFTIWAGITVAILCIMEGLSAFLHALRLHWVEFQGNFYKGEGYEFVPFSFETILSDDK